MKTNILHSYPLWILRVAVTSAYFLQAVVAIIIAAVLYKFTDRLFYGWVGGAITGFSYYLLRMLVKAILKFDIGYPSNDYEVDDSFLNSLDGIGYGCIAIAWRFMLWSLCIAASCWLGYFVADVVTHQWLHTLFRPVDVITLIGAAVAAQTMVKLPKWRQEAEVFG